MTLSFDFSKAVNLSLVQIPLSSQTINILPDNGHYAQFYSTDTYSISALLAEFNDVCSLITLFLLGISYFGGGKMIIAEMAMVFQVAYVSTLTVPQLNPFNVALTHLHLTFNPIYSLSLFGDQAFDDVLT